MRATAFAISLVSAMCLAMPSQASQSVTYKYDDLGRLSTATYDNNKTITYNMDPAGNRSQVAVASTPHMALAKPKHKHNTKKQLKRH